MANMGQTIFQRQILQGREDAQAARQKLVEDRQYDLRVNQLALQEMNSAEDSKQKEFWKQLQMAQLMGKAASADENYTPPATSNRAKQEQYDLGGALGTYETKKAQLTNAWRLPWQAEIGNRETLNRTSRDRNAAQTSFDRQMGIGHADDRTAAQLDVTMRGQDMNLAGRREMAQSYTYGRMPAGVQLMNTMRDDLHQDKTYQNSQVAEANYRTVMNATPGGAGDIALIVGYNYLVEPNSIVTEGEFRRNQFAAPLTDKISAAWNNLLKGGVVAEHQRQLIRDEAAKLYTTRRALGDAKRKEYEDMARRYGLDERNLMGQVPAMNEGAGFQDNGGSEYE